ncbi:MAG: RNA polymerase sigma factor [Okeania sp. SIO3B5]|uniref:RNA polymerase sigma factor n=1 Tax=Okeania sp. SIO3B5 TaxID=2607811 RepID=UPI0013FF6438|nr:RNA polymerase sigma factor [Okeania sp. SIO3B5]NEO57733.1 RNA polymerase sigma factor [Okeania sp. SIO3B5]
MDFALTERGNLDLVGQFWEQWIEHQDMLYRCCLRLMNSNHTDAEDALSLAMLKAWEKVQRFRVQITNIKAWLIQLTRNLCIDIIRERSRHARGVESIEWVSETDEMGMASSVELPESFLEREERSIEIRQAIADLPERLRGTFILHFYEELTHTEIAERQGISYENVCRRIYVAKKKLKEKLSNYFLGTRKKVSFTAGKGRKLSTSRKNKDQQQSIESEEKNGLKIGMKQLPGDATTFDGHSISLSPHHLIAPSRISPHHPITPSPHHPITPSQQEVVEVEKSEFVDSCVELGGNLGQTIQEVATVLVEVESDRVVEAEQQECVESAVESREQVNQKIQETTTELTEVECVEVFEVEQDGCVESSVESYQIRRITISKSLQLKRSGRKQSQGFRRLLPIVTMTTVQLDFVSKDNKHIQKINNFIQPFPGTGSKSYQKNLFLYRPLSEKISSLLPFASCLSTASKSYQKKSLVCCLSRKRSRWLRPYVMWRRVRG